MQSRYLRKPTLMLLGFGLGLCACSSAPPLAASPAVSALEASPAGEVAQAANSGKLQTATLAGGCFWAIQSEFEKLKGVTKVTAGFAGGTTKAPSYEQVCTGTTGHAETCQIVFDPAQISYAELVKIFLTDIDPTTKDRQGNDSGTQYRSAIFYHDAAQKATAEKVIAEVNQSKLYSSPIVTEVDPYQAFYPAEAYHQDFFASHPTQPYCAMVVGPELRRFLKMNKARLKPQS